MASRLAISASSTCMSADNGKNNRAELAWADPPNERKVQRFKSAGSARKFLSMRAAVRNASHCGDRQMATLAQQAENACSAVRSRSSRRDNAQASDLPRFAQAAARDPKGPRVDESAHDDKKKAQTSRYPYRWRGPP